MKKRNIRIIPKLEIKNGNLIKGINLDGLRVLGDPMLFAKDYYNQGADEIIYLDNVASLYGTNNLTSFIKNTAKEIFIPMTVGGGIRNLHDIEKMLKNGADKVSINSAAIEDINIIKKASRIFGSSTIVSNVECIKIKNKYLISKNNGRDLISTSPYLWVKKLEDAGVGEIIVTSVNFDGLQEGFDVSLTSKISKSVKVPVIASGGAGSFENVFDIIKQSNIQAVSISSFFHYDICTKFNFKRSKVGNYHFLENLKKRNSKNNLKKLKIFLKKKGVNVR